ncbi:MAG: MerR family transcriptional regulator [Humidesulfovibrio sp.]|nr:MerR family transcriptional regulator [Humidesulfovibrio sp.]
MVTQTYTHRDLARLLGVSETTVKSYRSKFPCFLPVAREGKPVRLHPEALAVCRSIRDLFADGLTILQATGRLRAEFKEYPLNRRLSTARWPAVGSASHPGLDSRLEALAQAQELARQRMEQLEAEVRNLAILEAASKALVAELLQEFRAARAVPAPPQPPRPEQPYDQADPAEPAQPATAAQPETPAGPTVVTARKIVTVHGQAGALASYALGREPRPEPPFAPPARPEAAFLDLPAVIRSDRGEFLGLPGGQSVARLVDFLTLQGGGPVSWFAEGPQAWTCEAPLGPALTRELLFERTTTPRGNLVGLIRRLRTLSGSGAEEASALDLQEFFRQVRDQLNEP